MSMIGSVRAGLGSVPTASGSSGGSGDGTIREITSEDGSVTITNPTGPVTDVSVPGALDIVIGEVSFGVGVAGVDDVIPVLEGGTAAYMGVGMTTDTIGEPNTDLADTPRYGFAAPFALDRLQLRVFITDLSATGTGSVGVGGYITIDGVRDTSLQWGLLFTDSGSEANVVQTPAADIVVAAGQHIGVTIETNSSQSTANCRVHIVIVGVRDFDEGPFISDNLILRLESTTVETDADGLVTTWTNLATTGAPFDAVPMDGEAPRPPPTLIPAAINGLPVVRFGLDPDPVAGGNVLVARTYPIAPFAPNVSGAFAPRYWAFAGRITSVDVYSTGMIAWFNEDGPGAGAIFASAQHSVPINAAVENAQSNVAWSNGDGFFSRDNYPVPLVSLSGQIVVAEHWIDDDGVLHSAINGGELTLDDTDPNPNGDDAPSILFYSLGANPTGFTEGGLGQTALADHLAIFGYNVCPSAGERAKTRNYLLTLAGLS